MESTIYGTDTIMYPSVFITFRLRSSTEKALLDKRVEQTILESMKGFKERYAIEIQQVGFDRDHVHILCRFMPKYSGGHLIWPKNSGLDCDKIVIKICEKDRKYPKVQKVCN